MPIVISTAYTEGRQEGRQDPALVLVPQAIAVITVGQRTTALLLWTATRTDQTASFTVSTGALPGERWENAAANLVPRGMEGPIAKQAGAARHLQCPRRTGLTVVFTVSTTGKSVGRPGVALVRALMGMKGLTARHPKMCCNFQFLQRRYRR